MRISDWSSDVCSSDLADVDAGRVDALVVGARVGAGEVHELEQAELRVDSLAGERPHGAGTGGVDHHHLARVELAHEVGADDVEGRALRCEDPAVLELAEDRKSTRLNSSH